MKHLKLRILLFSLCFCAQAEAASIQSQVLKYEVSKKTYVSSLYFDDSKKDLRPGILLVPEWWGMTQLEKDEATRLAGLGYVVLVVDLFGNAKSTLVPSEAEDQMNEAQKDWKELHARFQAAYDQLAKAKYVNKNWIGVIGFGFGGGVALDQLRQGVDLKVVVNFFGGLAPGKFPVKKIESHSDVLVLAGDSNAYVPKKQYKDFEKEMNAMKTHYELKIWPTGQYGFTRPEAEAIHKKYKFFMKYDPEITKESWKLVDALLQKELMAPSKP